MKRKPIFATLTTLIFVLCILPVSFGGDSWQQAWTQPVHMGLEPQRPAETDIASDMIDDPAPIPTPFVSSTDGQLKPAADWCDPAQVEEDGWELAWDPWRNRNQPEPEPPEPSRSR